MSSAVAKAEYSEYIIYADESGDPNPASVDGNYPVFVLNFCVFRKDHYAASVLPAVAAFKFEHFGHDDGCYMKTKYSDTDGLLCFRG